MAWRKQLNFHYIYLIFYKIAKKANPQKKICPIEKRYHKIYLGLKFVPYIAGIQNERAAVLAALPCF